MAKKDTSVLPINQARNITAEKIYEELKNDRVPYITRAEQCADLTLPNLFPRQGDNQSGGTDEIRTPYQSVGSRAVQTLAAKFVMSLLPANQAFWKYEPPDELLLQAQRDKSGKQQNLLEQTLIRMEDIPLRWLERNNVRAATYEACLQLILAGNALFHIPPSTSNVDSGIRVYKLNEYVVSRDNIGNILQLITKDTFQYESLPPEYRQYVKTPMQTDDFLSMGRLPHDGVNVYTHVYLLEDGKTFAYYKEIDGSVINGTTGTVPSNASYWIPLRMYKRDGEHYSRSLVEFYYGDLKTLETLWKSIIDLAGLSSRSFILVRSGSSINVKKLQAAENGSCVSGNEGDLTPFQHNKAQDFQTVYAAAQAIQERILLAFMEPSSIQRDAERQTATEWRYMTQALDNNFGGIYSLLASEFQMPLIKALTEKLDVSGDSKEVLPKGVDKFTPKIVTGFDALGRGQDLEKLEYFTNLVIGLGDAGWNELNLQGLLGAVAISLGLNTKDILKSDEQKQQELEQQMQLMQMQQQLEQGGEVAQ